MNPSLYSPSDVGKIYSPRPEFIFEGTKNRTKTTAYEDKRKVALLTVDGQIDFVYPDGGLPVPGAIEDIRRLASAIMYHSAARGSQPTLISKGTNPRTEHYGIFKAEVEDPKDVSTQLNTTILDAIAKHDLIYVAGEAKSHCVLETMNQLVSYFGKTQPETIKKIRFLMDCTSSVQNPNVDFEALANIELEKMVQKGVVLVKSTDPIS
ncbi:MAG: hypothetical protein UW96_C0020G0005 [Candidatus Collierbacteria bacterium GW2011_GWA1_45_15]|nr:MAG: hypothetical protein UW96_C0020G0005 [Candidatus Collierbacteria bacterium GW2011_GWA1_45_15]